MSEETSHLKIIAESVASAHLVANPGKHVCWGKRELCIYTGCTERSIYNYLNHPDFPAPAVSDSMKNRRWRSLDVIKWYESHIIQNAGRPRVA